MIRHKGLSPASAMVMVSHWTSLFLGAPLNVCIERSMYLSFPCLFLHSSVYAMFLCLEGKNTCWELQWLQTDRQTQINRRCRWEILAVLYVCADLTVSASSESADTDTAGKSNSQIVSDSVRYLSTNSSNMSSLICSFTSSLLTWTSGQQFRGLHLKCFHDTATWRYR